MMNQDHSLCGAILTVAMVGCSLLPTRPTGCSNERPCPIDQRCNSTTSICEPVDSQPDLSPTTDFAPPPDLSGTPQGMVYVPGGTFMMGTDTGDPEERPTHQQTVAAFYLDITKVTSSSFSTCIAVGKCSSAPSSMAGCNYTVLGREDHPVNCVTLSQANEFCAVSGKRLPTEIELEYAARGPQGSEYSWGNDAPVGQLCWNTSSTCAASSFNLTLNGKIDSNGVSDLAGNLKEWTASPQCDYPLTASGGVNCMSGILKPVRGSAYNANTANLVRATQRGSADSTYQYFINIGFRCAKSIN